MVKGREKREKDEHPQEKKRADHARKEGVEMCSKKGSKKLARIKPLQQQQRSQKQEGFVETGNGPTMTDLTSDI